MKVQCSHCKTVYDLDDKKIPNKKIKFKCRKCQKPVYVNKINGPAGAYSHPKQMVCPNCGQQQAVTDECTHCGTTVVKHKREVKPNGDRHPPPELEAETQPREKQAAKGEIVNCPKCAFEIQSDDLECLNCGIVLEKYRALEAKKKEAEEETHASE
jgi:predicted Zn finger-like uncharacterized protein